jgi:hypothetical protein
MEQSSGEQIARKHLTLKKVTRVMRRIKKRVCYIELFKEFNIIPTFQEILTLITAICSG